MKITASQTGKNTDGTGICRMALPAKTLFACFALLVACGAASTFAQDKPNPQSEIGGLQSKFVDVNSVKARYYEAGEGDAMVMVHGGFTAGSSTANVFSRNIPGLAKHFHIYAVDRLGSGMSGNPTENKQYSYQGDVDFIYNFIQTLKLGKVHLVGHSAGGAIVLYLAVEHPEIVRTLTILAVGPENPPQPQTKLANMLKKCPDQTQYAGLKCRVVELAWLPTTFDDEYWRADEYMSNLPKSKEAREIIRSGAGQSRADAAKYRDEMLERIKMEGVLQMPVLMVAGKDDVLDWSETDATAQLKGELALFDVIATKNTKVQMFIFNNAGHFMYREHPQEFNDLLVTWITYWNKNIPEPPAGNFQLP
ncbi:MAG: alpha/beta hydrolase [Candidatus Acidiferrales bacterium]